MNIFWGLVGIAISYGLIRYRHHVIGFTGPWGFVEKYLGSGQSATACVLLGVFTFFVSISLMFGLLDDMVGGMIKPFLGGGLPQK
jgi:hypothetical protein